MQAGPPPTHELSVQPPAPLPRLTVASTKQIYEALRRGKAVPEHPLLDFLWIRQQVGWASGLPDAGIPPIELYDALTTVLTLNLAKLRAVHELPPLNPDLSASEATADLARVAQTNNRFLIGGTAIFYRYVRYDLDWQVREIARYLGQSARSTGRDMNDFWSLLTEAWLRLEMDTRKHHWGS